MVSKVLNILGAWECITLTSVLTKIVVQECVCKHQRSNGHIGVCSEGGQTHLFSAH